MIRKVVLIPEQTHSKLLERQKETGASIWFMVDKAIEKYLGKKTKRSKKGEK